MKNIAMCYRGFFNIKKSLHSVDDNMIELANQHVLNHIHFLISPLKECGFNINFFISTYKIKDSVNDVFINAYEPEMVSFLDESFSRGSTWVAQLNHYKRLIQMITLSESENNLRYDYILITRNDIKFLQKFTDLGPDFNKFNILYEHPCKGGCDDNIWFFPRCYLQEFEKSVNSLLEKNGITHAINKNLLSLGVEINYLNKNSENLFFDMLDP